MERNIVFLKEEIPYIEDLLVEGIMVETEGENDDENDDEYEKEVSINPEATEMKPVPIEPIPAIPAMPENPTMPKVRHSTHNKQPSRYVRDLTSGEFTTGSEKEKIPTSLQVPKLNEEVSALAMLARMSEANSLELITHIEAMKSPDWLWWKEAMDEEMGALEAHKTWEVVDMPKGVNIVGLRWTFVLKRDALGSIVRYKALFDTYAPVAKMATIRTVLALAAHHDHEIHQVNVKNAFLNGAFEDNETIYMKLPPATELTEQKGKVLRLLKPLYGLRQSACHWYSCLWGVLRDGLKMKRCEVDQAAFYWQKGEESIEIIAHVDDLMIITSSMAQMERAKGALKKAFKISDMGEIHWILGFSVKQNHEARTISLSQAAYIRSVLEKFGFENLRPYTAPMDPNLKLSTADSPKTAQEFAIMRDKPHQELISSAQYAACGTRLDITYAVNTLSQYLENPGPAHWSAIKHLFGYLSGMADWELTYGKIEKDLEGYGDADGSMHEDRKAVRLHIYD